MKKLINSFTWFLVFFTIGIWYIVAESEGVRADRIQNEAVELGYAYYDNSGDFIWIRGK